MACIDLYRKRDGCGGSARISSFLIDTYVVIKSENEREPERYFRSIAEGDDGLQRLHGATNSPEQQAAS